MTLMVNIASMVFSYLNVSLSSSMRMTPLFGCLELHGRSPMPGITAHDSLPVWNSRLGDTIQSPNAEEQYSPASDWYFCFDLPAVIGKFFRSFGSVFRRNILKEKRLSLVAIQPG